MSIRVRPITANLTHDTQSVDKMDPYVKIYFGGQQYRTKVCQFGGKNPSWNDTFVFNASNDSSMRIEVWDNDMISDDLIGEGSFNLMRIYNMPSMRSENEYIDLLYKGRAAGRILIAFELQNMNGYWGQPQGMMGNNQMGGNWGNNSGWNGGMQPMGQPMQPMMGGGNGWGQPPMNGGYGMQPPMNGGYGVQPPMGGQGWGNMPPPNNGWGQQNQNNGWGW